MGKPKITEKDIEELENIIEEKPEEEPKESDKLENLSREESQEPGEQSNDVNLSPNSLGTLEGLGEIQLPEKQRESTKIQTTLCKMIDETIEKIEKPEHQEHRHLKTTSQIDLSKYVEKDHMVKTLEDIFEKLGNVFKRIRKRSNNELDVYIYNEIKRVLKFIAQKYRELTGNYGRLMEYLGVRRNVSRKK